MGKPALHQLHWCIQEATWRHPLDLQLRASLLGGIQGTACEDGEDCTECFCPKGRERGGGRNPRWRRLDKHSRPHASFNKGISEWWGEKKKRKSSQTSAVQHTLEKLLLKARQAPTSITQQCSGLPLITSQQKGTLECRCSHCG